MNCEQIYEREENDQIVKGRGEKTNFITLVGFPIIYLAASKSSQNPRPELGLKLRKPNVQLIDIL